MCEIFSNGGLNNDQPANPGKGLVSSLNEIGFGE